MNINFPISSLLKPYSHIVPVLILSVGSLLTLSACQKEPEPETTTKSKAEPNIQSTAIATSVDDEAVDDIAIDGQVADAAETEREVALAELENNIGAAGVTPNAETTTPSPEQAIKGTQITDVQYRSTEGATISVVFETSATGVLNAIISLPNQPKMTLSAPEGQGNNPTYRSKDGNIQLVSHGGGSTIDLMQNNKITSFEATSAEAEVVTQP